MPHIQLILNFREFLLSCWGQLSINIEYLDWDADPYYIDTWIQANWELMVEKLALNKEEYFPPYGYDENAGCRHTNIGKDPTHRVMVCPKNETKKYFFLCFTSVSEELVKFEPPFDWVAAKDLSTGNVLMCKYNEVNFFIEKLS